MNYSKQTLYRLYHLYRRNKLMMFSDKLEAIKKEFADKEVHFDIKM